MTQLTKRDKEMLELCCKMEIQMVAEKLHIDKTTIYARLSWLRKKKVENQTFVNQLNNYAKTCDYMKKLLTSGDRKKIKPEEEQNESS